MKSTALRNLLVTVLAFFASSLASIGQTLDGPGNTIVYNDSTTKFLYYEISTNYWYTDNGLPGQTIGYASGSIGPGTNSWVDTYNATFLSAFAGFPPDSVDWVFLNDFYWEYYTIPMTSPSSSNATIPYGPAFTPTNTGGSGGTTRMWCVAGHTNWGTGSWTPPGPGTYTFYVGMLPAAGYTTNTTDPNVGPIQVNYTAYTLTVN